MEPISQAQVRRWGYTWSNPVGNTACVDAHDINDPGDPGNKNRTRESQTQLRQLLMEWDPIGVAGVTEAADEYDCMISPLMKQLHDGAKERAIRRWIVREVEGHFSMRSDPRREAQLAADVVKWWAVRSEEPDHGAQQRLASWERTRGHLARAWVELPPGILSNSYQEFLDHNELGLAMEALAEAGDVRVAGRAFWLALADAASEMDMMTEVRIYQDRANPS